MIEGSLAWQSGKGWPGLYTVRMVVHSGEHSRRVRTVVVGIENFFRKNISWSACILNPMVVKLVGQ